MDTIREQFEPALVWTGKVMLQGRLAASSHPLATVIFASSPALADDGRDQRIIARLREAHITVLYVPLLTEEELQFDSRTSHYRHDAEFLGQRFIDVAQWTQRNRETMSLPLAYVGSSGSGAGALVAAALRPDIASSVVSIDGRTDLAVDYLRNVRIPALLLVKDMPVLRMNREALTLLGGERRIEIVHGAGIEAVESVVNKTVHWLEDTLSLVASPAYGMF